MRSLIKTILRFYDDLQGGGFDQHRESDEAEISSQMCIRWDTTLIYAKSIA